MGRKFVAYFSLGLLGLCGARAQSIDSGNTSNPRRWIVSWSASATASREGAPIFKRQTIRQLVHLSLGGDGARVMFSNRFGTRPLVIGAAGIAIPLLGSIVRPSSARTLKFGGQVAVSIPPGESSLSDPVALHIESLQDVAVSIYLPEATPVGTAHWAAWQTSYVTAGDRSGSNILWPDSTITFWPFLVRVDVMTQGSSAAIVTVGDSITDGDGSSRDQNRRWPDILAERLWAVGKTPSMAVLNAGIGGNRLLHDGSGPEGPQFGRSLLERFDRDILALPGVKYLIVLEGINDIGHPGVAAPLSERVTEEEIIVGLSQVIARTHARDLRIFGGTLTPFEGARFLGYYTPEREQLRQAVNRWIRSEAPYDAVIDFDRVVRDPNHPARLLSRYDSGDHIHPNDAGYRAMGEAVDLSLFQRR